jgi:hypothetical protein
MVCDCVKFENKYCTCVKIGKCFRCDDYVSFKPSEILPVIRKRKLYPHHPYQCKGVKRLKGNCLTCTSLISKYVKEETLIPTPQEDAPPQNQVELPTIAACSVRIDELPIVNGTTDEPKCD